MTIASTATCQPTAAQRLGALVLLCACAAAAAEELPRSPACQSALQALERAETALMAAPAASAPADEERRRAVAAKLYPQRQRVADACLGGLTASPPPSQRTWNAPPPQRYAPLPPRAQAPRAPDPHPLPRVDPPVTITHCNAATCVGSDGSTLTRVGPLLVGPRGSCTRQGVFVSCP